MTRRQRKAVVGAVYMALAGCPEPELVVEDAVVKAVLTDPNVLAWLKAVGLEVDPALLQEAEGDIVVSDEVMKDIVVDGRNASNGLRAISVEHAVKVATRLRLHADRHGDCTRLADAIGLVCDHYCLLIAMDYQDCMHLYL